MTPMPDIGVACPIVVGERIYVTSEPADLICLDKKTGRILWDVVLADWKKGYQYNVAPLIVRNMIILGPATNEAGANCWVSAYDTHTGKELWRFYTAPISAGDPAAKTWSGVASPRTAVSASPM